MLKEHFKRKAFQAVATVPDDPQKVYRCKKCQKIYYIDDVVNNQYICPSCNNYFPLTAKERLNMIVDKGSFKEFADIASDFDPLNFPTYMEKKQAARDKSGLAEAVVCGKAKIAGHKLIIAVMDSHFFMGSMGVEVGEKVCRAIELASKLQHPLVIFTASGGARMQEGIFSLFQMAKTSAALERFQAQGGVYITVLTNPTLGGVSASFAMLGDIIVAEKEALVGFAGPRVIEQTIGQKLPEGFQKADFLKEHGIIDAVVARADIKQQLANYLRLINIARSLPENRPVKTFSAFKAINSKKMREADRERKEAKAKLSGEKGENAMDLVYRARETKRPTARDFIVAICDEFHVLAGDRKSTEDEAIVAGLASIEGKALMVISQQKGRSIEENSRHNFGMVKPQGYRKALRLAKLAEKLNMPILTLIDTPGAYCGIEAEADGQAIAIAECLREFPALKTPSLAIVIGEGGSGGALALSVCDEIWMCENAVYSILSPEGFASILWKDSKRAEEAAKLMRLSAENLWEDGIVDRILREDKGFTELYKELRKDILEFFSVLHKENTEYLLERRYSKYRRIGIEN